MCKFVVYIVDGVLGRPKINASFPTFIARMKLKDSAVNSTHPLCDRDGLLRRLGELVIAGAT